MVGASVGGVAMSEEIQSPRKKRIPSDTGSVKTLIHSPGLPFGIFHYQNRVNLVMKNPFDNDHYDLVLYSNLVMKITKFGTKLKIPIGISPNIIIFNDMN